VSSIFDGVDGVGGAADIATGDSRGERKVERFKMRNRVRQATQNYNIAWLA
jgi:hypothetical protein